MLSLLVSGALFGTNELNDDSLSGEFMTSSKLILLRHGESLWNHENRFTGWVDVPLSDKGHQEAIKAGKSLMETGIRPDFACSSVLIRAIHSLWHVLSELNSEWVPTEATWRLNERHYGALQYLEKSETERKLGWERVKMWRKSCDGIPPPDFAEPFRLKHYPQYKHVSLKDLPQGESLEMTLHRLLPFWRNVICPRLFSGETVLVVSHSNTLRALISYIENIDKWDIPHLHIDTGTSIDYECVDAHLLPTSKIIKC